jgi:hypothetical protein
MKNPEDIVKFYAETAVFSHGEGSQPTTPTTIGPEKAILLKDRLFSSRSLTVDLAEGAIDAQMSCGGGVLVVVTGHMIEEHKGRRPFCHTFFLNVVPDSKKNQYFVYNDLFRFLSEEDTKQEVQVEEPKAEEEPVPVEEPAVVDEPAVVVEEAAEVLEPVLEEEPVVVEEPIVVEEEPPMYEPALEPEPAVEETKEEIVEEVKRRRKSKSRSGRKKSLSPTASESPKPAHGSWASLVANTNSAPVPVPVPVPESPARRAVVEKKEAPVKEDVKPEQGKRVQKRDPENTVVIKNIPEGTKEAQVRELFQPFAKETNSKLVGVNVSAKSNLAFVDFDSSAPVLLALQEKHRLQLNGRTLDVEQKVVDRAKKASGRQRGSQAEKEKEKDGNGFKRSNQQKNRRNSGGGRGERGGGGRGGRGGR